ncbi:hypothetical protein EDD15DRAFT_2197006 [Pisolithus albus]|nr:hypothetical protein EDD15DRAFT_2197006 [Pisolithus albus]
MSHPITLSAFNFQEGAQGSYQHTVQPLSHVWSGKNSRSASFITYHIFCPLTMLYVQASYYQTIDAYSAVAKPSMALATGTAAMDSTLLGMVKLQPHPVPAHDILKGGHKFNEFVNYIHNTQLLSHSINRAFQVTDPGFHAKLTHLREMVHQRSPAVKVFDDPLLFEGREIIFNRKSGLHVDKHLVVLESVVDLTTTA